MKWVKTFLLCVGIFGTVSLLLASDRGEFNRAMQYLNERGEVCFTFYVNSPLEILTLTNVISIDNVTGSEVFAYANKQEFAEFLKYNYYYEVQTPPGLLNQESIKMWDPSSNLPYEWDSYPSYSGYETMMNKFAADYPTLCRIEEFGTSIKGKKLLAAKISDNVGTEEAEPYFFQQSSIHGDEVCGYVLMLRLIDYLLSNYNKDARVTRLVDSMQIWINPDGNPDGTYYGGDGSVSGSRRYNNNGVDLNRSFPSPTGSSEAQKQKETQHIMDFTKKYPMVMQADYHGGAEIICYIWGCWSTVHPDQPWWINVCKEYADTVHANSSGYFSGVDGTGYYNAFKWYKVEGERMNYCAWWDHSRDVTIELSITKVLGASNLPKHWDYNYRSFLNYMERALCGIRGVVTDGATGQPLKGVKVFVNSRDKDSSHVYTQKGGDYYRPIEAGTYSLTFSYSGYTPRTIAGVVVQNKKATILNVVFDNSAITTAPKDRAYLSVMPNGRGVAIALKNAGDLKSAAIYSMDGRLVKQLPAGQKQISWDGTNSAGLKTGNGCYLVRIVTGEKVITESFVFSR
jgi:hypothetical protein